MAGIDEQRWNSYLAGYHEQRPAITERLLTSADASPYAWLAEALGGVGEPILDLACGSAPVRPLLARSNWVGLDWSLGELGYAAAHGRGPLVRARAEALPMASASVGAVCAAMCLPVLTPLDGVLGEVARVLRPGGRLVALVPSAGGVNATHLATWARIMWWLGVWRQPWPNPQARGGVARVLRQAGFDVHTDERRTFTVPLGSPRDADLLVDGLYLPGVSDARILRSRRRLAALARPGRRLALPLRRVVASVRT